MQVERGSTLVHAVPLRRLEIRHSRSQDSPLHLRGPKRLRRHLPSVAFHRSCGGCRRARNRARLCRSEEHTSELQSLMRISYAVFCLKKKICTTLNNNQTERLYHNKRK